jgi:hypothetical protein
LAVWQLVTLLARPLLIVVPVVAMASVLVVLVCF